MSKRVIAVLDEESQEPHQEREHAYEEQRLENGLNLRATVAVSAAWAVVSWGVRL
jgi:hypothetical protein